MNIKNLKEKLGTIKIFFHLIFQSFIWTFYREVALLKSQFYEFKSNYYKRKLKKLGDKK